MEEGKWITINGNHILLEDGETPEQAIEKLKARKEPTSLKEGIDDMVKESKSKTFTSFGKVVDGFNNANSGYVGQSMSVRAKSAYENGEMPLSKWTKDDILDGIQNLNPNLDLSKIEKLSTQDLKDLFLRYSSWHHTGKYFNNTNFYSIDDALEEMSQEDFNKMVDAHLESKNQPIPQSQLDYEKEQKIMSKYKGDVSFKEWEGTGRYKRPKEVTIENADIEKKGDWIIVTKDGKTFKKKYYNINVFNKKYNKQQKEILRNKEIAENQRQLDSFNKSRNIEEYQNFYDRFAEDTHKDAIVDWFNELIERSKTPVYGNIVDWMGARRGILNRNLITLSNSGNVYEDGRKPNMEQALNPSSFFKVGEKRLGRSNNDKYILQMWDGEKWVEYNKDNDTDKKSFTNFDKKSNIK